MIRIYGNALKDHDDLNPYMALIEINDLWDIGFFGGLRSRLVVTNRKHETNLHLNLNQVVKITRWWCSLSML